MLKAISKSWKLLIDALLPPLCLSCGAAVEAEGGALCAGCWKKVNFIAPPVCECCGIPFGVPVGDGTLCGACIARAPAFDYARSAMVYDAASRGMILSFKHGDGLHVAKSLAAWMGNAGEKLLAGNEIVIVPVPLSRWRLFTRRYNQSAILAAEIGKRVPAARVCVDALLRVKNTPSQGHLNRDERVKNLAGAIAINPSRRNAIKGKKAVLIDDVMTTGATANECSRILRKAGASSVSVLTLARVGGSGD